MLIYDCRPHFLAVNHQNDRNWVPFILTHNLWLIFMGMKQKKIKTEFFNSANSQYFFSKISWIGPWVSRIEWCEGHWFGSTHMAMRLSDIRAKTGQKKPFCFIPIKISHELCNGMDGTQFWCFPWFPPNSLLCVIYRYTV